MPSPRYRSCSTRQLARGRGLRPHRRHLPPARRGRAATGPVVRIAFDRPEVRNAFRPHTVDELYRALDHARMTPDVGCVLLTGNGPSPAGRRLGVLLRRRPADPRPGRLPVRRGRDRRHGRPGPGRPAAHPRGAAADPVHAQGRDRGRARAGRPAAGTRLHVVCDLTLASRRARPVQADRRRRRVASTAATARPTWPGRSGRSSPARSSSSAASTPPRTAHRMGMVNAVVPHAELERGGAGLGARDQRQVARPRSGC